MTDRSLSRPADPVARAPASRRCCAWPDCGRRGSAWRWPNCCSAARIGMSAPSSCMPRPTARRSTCRWRRSTTRLHQFRAGRAAARSGGRCVAVLFRHRHLGPPPLLPRGRAAGDRHPGLRDRDPEPARAAQGHDRHPCRRGRAGPQGRARAPSSSRARCRASCEGCRVEPTQSKLFAR